MSRQDAYQALGSQEEAAMDDTGSRNRTGRSSSLHALPIQHSHTVQAGGRMRSFLKARDKPTALTRVIVLCMTLFIIISAISSLVRKSEESRTFSPDNAFSRLPEKVQQRLSMRALSFADQRDRTMDAQRCQREFPLLYPQLEDLEAYWKERGGVTRQLVDTNDKGAAEHWGHARLIVHNGQIFIRTFREGAETRNSALVHLIQQAVDSWPSGPGGKESLPTIDLVLSPGDRDLFPEDGGWGVTRHIRDERATGRWLIPDFGFIGWPEASIASFEEFLDLAAKVEKQHPWHKKAARAFWRGFVNVYAVRMDMMDRADPNGHPEREAWSDIHPTTFDTNLHGNFFPLVSLPDHCRHKYLVHVEGNSYSGRSRYLFSCHSVTIAHPLEWTQHFHPALNNVSTSPHQNYVQLPGPLFNGLEQGVKLLRLSDGTSDGQREQDLLLSSDDPEKPPVKIIERNSAKQIADNAARTLRDRYLTPAATMCYTRAAFQHYARAMNATTWGPEGPTVLPGQGVGPNSSKGRPMNGLKGDIEVGVWRLLGSPNWPPSEAKV